MKTRLKNIVKQRNGYNVILRVALGLLFCTLSFSSCKKFIEIPAPDTQLVTASVFNNNASATAAITDIYTQMFNNAESSYMASDNGLLADELTNYQANPSQNFNYYTDAMPAGILNFGPWQNAYSYIYQANAVLSGLQEYKGTSSAVKQQLTGEAYFIRAFWYFYLSNCYGAVPLALTTDYTVTSKLARTPRVQALQQVVADLQSAQIMLSSNYVDATDTAIISSRVRPNKAVASALLARAYLYLGDYDHNNVADYTNADKAASSVISNNLYNLPALNDVFLVTSTEAIWQIATPLPSGVNTFDGQYFILLTAPAGSNVTISPQLLGTFEPGDQRKINWIDTLTAGGTTYYFPYKYKAQTGGNPITEYTMVLRLAEQYLIRAEARVHEGNLAGAASDLNLVRNRAGLPNTTAATATGLAAAVLHERQVELFTEWGHRWFDLNRTGNTGSVLGSPGNVCAAKGGTWNPSGYQELYPIPQSDINIDVNLTQNPGY